MAILTSEAISCTTSAVKGHPAVFIGNVIGGPVMSDDLLGNIMSLICVFLRYTN